MVSEPTFDLPSRLEIARLEGKPAQREQGDVEPEQERQRDDDGGSGLSSGLLRTVTENLLANFRGRGDVLAFRSVMKPTPNLPQPPVSMVEEWDNPAMTEFKHQEAEERVAFGRSSEARQWLEHFRNTPPPEVIIRVAPKVPKRFPFKRVRLPW